MASTRGTHGPIGIREVTAPANGRGRPFFAACVASLSVAAVTAALGCWVAVTASTSSTGARIIMLGAALIATASLGLAVYCFATAR